MTFTGIHHLVIRVHDLDASIAHWTQTLDMALTRTSENPALGVKQAFFELQDGGFIELVAPLSDDSPVAKALDARGEGVHLISMSVANPTAAAAALKERGVTLVGAAEGPQFVHPRSASGVMLGLAQADEA